MGSGPTAGPWVLGGLKSGGPGPLLMGGPDAAGLIKPAFGRCLRADLSTSSLPRGPSWESGYRASSDQGKPSAPGGGWLERMARH